MKTLRTHPRPARGTRLAGAALALVLAPAALAQEARPDQVHHLDKKSGSLVTSSGKVVKNDLDGVTLEGQPPFEAARVRRVIFGEVPESFREAEVLEQRGDLANAAAKFKLAAADEDARGVVRAAARLRAAEALLLHGAVDPASFAEADTSATRFLEEHPQNREVPLARAVQARARLAAGDAASAAELFRALYREASGATPTPGYDLVLCLHAGLRGANAYLLAGETLPAREIFQGIDATLPRVIASLPENDERRAHLLELQTQARLGEGFVLLASGSTSQARSFFEQHAASADSSSAERYGVRLGMGLVNLADGRFRQAQFDFAAVSAIDHTDRDRAARALIGLAEATLKLPDEGAGARARSWLQSVRDQYPDSIWVRRAQELSANL